ncbi:ATP-binding protein [Streptomyces sp. NBC_01520]|uniref:ATP-binding protein n=1 Tax=Streptomyces sp. NBC_01520 TaxID=2903892 RepID=UPI003863C058
MPPYPRTALCPSAEASSARFVPSRATVGLTLPGHPRSSAVARGAVSVVLRAHGLTAYRWPAVLVAAELVTVAAKLTPGRDLYLSLRYRDDVLRLLVWDQHPRHPVPAAEALCAGRRRALWLLATVVDDWGGEWGTGEAAPPQRGTRSWVTLPR